MSSGRITKDSDPARWEALCLQWEKEKRPGWLVVGTTTYQVLQLIEGVVFEPRTGQGYYESISTPFFD